jgi:hypothetical protein
LNACELTTTITAIANSLACNLSTDNMLLAAAIFTQLGDTLATIAAQNQACQSQPNPANNLAENSQHK